MYKLQNYIAGKWIEGEGEGQLLANAVTGEPFAAASSKGIDFESMLKYARQVGNPALRKMSFYERGNMLKALALHLREHLAEFYRISYLSGATKVDSWIDIEGGIGNLFANASLRRKFPDEMYAVDGETHSLGKNNTFIGTHILVPKEGVAIHINAYNFPVWGMLEKIAVNLLAGMPAVVKPATVTSYLTEARHSPRGRAATRLRQRRRHARPCALPGCGHLYRLRIHGIEAEIPSRHPARGSSLQHGGRFAELHRAGK
jgi:oxepin-CoA hydrolase/3-oxo-5,6-dehydrosuberyl-CoA semialdehyde dehydrogenase